MLNKVLKALLYTVAGLCLVGAVIGVVAICLEFNYDVSVSKTVYTIGFVGLAGSRFLFS